MKKPKLRVFKCPVCPWKVTGEVYTPTWCHNDGTIKHHITVMAKRELWMKEVEKVQTPHLRFFRKNKIVTVKYVRRLDIDYKTLK